LLEGCLRLRANFLGKATVVGPELVRDPLTLAHLGQKMRVLLHLPSGVRKDEIVCASKHLEKMRCHLARGDGLRLFLIVALRLHHQGLLVSA
jgi:hypothetical protein